jgi:glycosyltransferase involved in cell wall biosynthesis
MLSARNLAVQVVNFDYDRRYARDTNEIVRRSRIVNASLSGVRLVELSALRLRIPRRFSPFGRRLTKSINENLRFVPAGLAFPRVLRNSDVVYFVFCQSNPIYLLMTLAVCAVSGRRPVIAGFHVTPKLKPSHLAALRFFLRVGVLRNVHVMNEDQRSLVTQKIGCTAVYVPNGVQYERFSSGNTDGSSRGEFSILYAGAMTLKKGVDLIPEVYASLKKRGVLFKFIICTAGGPLLEQIRDWSSGKPDIDFKGFVDPDNMPHVYRESALVLLPSRGEAFPLVCIEAQASGTPVVVSDISGFRQCVVSGVTGLFAVKDSAESFADKIETIYDLWKHSSNDYSALRKNASRYIRDNFQLKDVTSKLTDMLLTVAVRK